MREQHISISNNKDRNARYNTNNNFGPRRLTKTGSIAVETSRSMHN